MQKNLNARNLNAENFIVRWEEQVKLLQEDKAFAKKFVKFILTDSLQEDVEVEAVSVHLQKGKCKEEDKLELVATIIACGFRRTMEIFLYKSGNWECDRSFKCCYYCVEAPSILLDSGKTRMNLEVREDLLERWEQIKINSHT